MEDIMSIEKRAEIDEALESKQRFKGFIDDAPNALNLVNKRIDDEIARATGVENQLRADLTAETERATDAEQALETKISAETSARTSADTQLSSDIEELGNTINGQIQSINGDITALEARVTALEQAQAGGQ